METNLKTADTAFSAAGFWRRNYGYFIVVFLGLILATAGFFQPIEDLWSFFGCGILVLIVLGFVLSLGSKDLTGFGLVFGFGGFWLALYGIGFALAAFSFGWVFLALFAALTLFGVGIIAAESK